MGVRVKQILAFLFSISCYLQELRKADEAHEVATTDGDNAFTTDDAKELNEILELHTAETDGEAEVATDEDENEKEKADVNTTNNESEASAAVWTKHAGKAIRGKGCRMGAYNTVLASGATWRSRQSLKYKSLSECEDLCEAEAFCVGFVDNHQANPPYCVFKKTTNSYSKSSKDVWTQPAAQANYLIKARHGVCLDSNQRNKNGGKIHMWACNANNHNQWWIYNHETGQVKMRHGRCLDSNQRNKVGGNVHIWNCNTNNENQQWVYNSGAGQIKARIGHCLDASQRNKDGGKVHMWSCDTANANQQWTIGTR